MLLAFRGTESQGAFKNQVQQNVAAWIPKLGLHGN